MELLSKRDCIYTLQQICVACAITFLEQESEVERLRSLPKIIQPQNGRATIGNFIVSKSCTPNHLTILSLIRPIKLY